MRLAIDIDSTLHPYWDQLAEIAQRRFGIDLPWSRSKTPGRFGAHAALEPLTGDSDSQHTRAIDRLQPEQLGVCVEETHRAEHVLAAEPYPGAVEAIQAWHEQGHFHPHHEPSRDRRAPAHQRVARADRPPARRALLLRRQARPLPGEAKPVASSGARLAAASSTARGSRSRDRGIDVLIDDSPVNLAAAVEAGITAATIEHPWSRDLDDVISAPDWPTLATRLQPVLE